MSTANSYIALLKNSIVDHINQDEVEEIIGRAYNDRLFPTVYSRLLSFGYRLSEKWKKKYDESLVEMQTMSNELSRIWDMLTRDYNPLLVKGFALSKQIFNKENARYFWDLDILFPSDCNIRDVYHQMMELGYYQYMDFNDGTQGRVLDTKGYLQHSVRYHELRVINETSQSMPVYAELKSSTSVLSKELIDCFIKHSVLIDLFGKQYRTFDDIHSFIHTCINAVEYEIFLDKSAIKLRNFYDLYEFVKNRNVNIYDLQNFTNEYDLTSKVKQALLETADLFHDKKCRDLSKQLTQVKSELHTKVEKTGDMFICPQIQWDTSIEDRVFSVDNSFASATRALKKMLYSDLNPGYVNASKLIGDIMQVKVEDTLISYAIIFLNDLSGFKVIVNQETRESGTLSRAYLKVINPDLEDDVIEWSFLILVNEAKKIVVLCEQLEAVEKLDTISYLNDNNSIEIVVKFPSMISKSLLEIGRVVSSLEVAKEVYPHVYVTQESVSSVVICDSN